MTTPIKVLVTKKQAAKLATGNAEIMLQVHRKKKEPLQRFRARLSDVREVKAPVLRGPPVELVVGSGPDMKKFQDIFQEVKRLIGHGNTTAQSELERVGRQLLGSKLRGVYGKTGGESQELTRDQPYMIINTDDKDGHWYAVALDGDFEVIYDSLEPNGEDNDVEQDIDATSCGQFALAWLVTAHRHGLDYAKRI